MKLTKVILILLLPLYLCMESCGQKDSRYVAFFKETPAYELAKAVEEADLRKIEKLVKRDSTLLEVTEPEYGSNVLVLCLYVEEFDSFKKLLELGADHNFINPFDKHSVLIDAIVPFGSSFEWIEDNRYVELLLEYGADPNYAIENDFTNDKGRYVMATSPLMRAADLNLDVVKTLIKFGADPYRKLGENLLTPFGEALEATKVNIIYYFIDTLKVDIHQPLFIRSKDSLFIQDYIVTKLMLKNIRAEQQGLPIDIEGDEERWELIKYLESKGVDFVDYKYKRLK